VTETPVTFTGDETLALLSISETMTDEVTVRFVIMSFSYYLYTPTMTSSVNFVDTFPKGKARDPMARLLNNKEGSYALVSTGVRKSATFTTLRSVRPVACNGTKYHLRWAGGHRKRLHLRLLISQRQTVYCTVWKTRCSSPDV